MWEGSTPDKETVIPVKQFNYKRDKKLFQLLGKISLTSHGIFATTQA
jgi:hypothetical protein